MEKYIVKEFGASFRLTIRNVNFIWVKAEDTEIVSFRLTIRNVN